jgi:glycosyltransferase involved in cell wall biosynthesis
VISISTPDTASRASVDITVILCTYNRCEELAGALHSIALSQVASSVTWEVLVVDNNSTDRTRNIVENFCCQYPGHFRYLFEAQPGKSYALNAGIANASGDVLAFVDDDVTVEPTWLQNLTAELLNDGKWAGAGGRTLPAQKFTPPSWLSNDVNDWGGIIFAYFDQGNEAGELTRAPYGANMAFRKSVFEKYGRFRIDLGPTPNSQIRNEDTELGRRLLAAGERLRYEPSAVVYHPVPQGRITQDYFFPWWFDYGRALIRERGDRSDAYRIPGDYLSLLARAAEMLVMTLRWIFALHPQKRFLYRCLVWKAAGQMTELYRRSVGEKGTKVPAALETKSGRPSQT